MRKCAREASASEGEGRQSSVSRDRGGALAAQSLLDEWQIVCLLADAL